MVDGIELCQHEDRRQNVIFMRVYIVGYDAVVQNMVFCPERVGVFAQKLAPLFARLVAFDFLLIEVFKVIFAFESLSVLNQNTSYQLMLSGGKLHDSVVF